MTQYLIAIWDYTAEGEFELSFKQGDRIKLLEKHNDDWWEGELNDQIGFFPANRIRLETTEAVVVEQTTTITTPTATTLPEGWESAYDEDGTIYYFNESTGESRWDKPDDTTDLVTTVTARLEPDELKKLELDKLQPEWIRHKGNIQMKMISEKEEGGKLSSWKVYYAVLSNGFLLLYNKESHGKSKKIARLPVGSFDLHSCNIDPAGKQDTKRKYVFIISTPHKVKLYIQTENDKDFSLWLDAIMRELIARKEGQNQDTEIMRLLTSLSIDEDHMKVNRKMTKDQYTEEKKPFWFTKANSKKMEPKYMPTPQSQPDENSVFGGYLRMEENGDVPYIVSTCIKEVEVRGLQSVGIYRLSGPTSSIQKYKAAFNDREHVTFKDEHDINAVTGLLKLYFRELRNPLMTFEYYDYFMEAAKISDYEERMFQIKSVLHSLPKPNFIVLEYLMRHLSHVASYSEINKMEASNLALIFSVSLLRPVQGELSGIMQSDLQSKVIEALILQADWFFEQDEQ